MVLAVLAVTLNARWTYDEKPLNAFVVELNDEISGLDNNRVQIDVYVSQVGVRLTPLLSDGSYPSTPSEFVAWTRL